MSEWTGISEVPPSLALISVYCQHETKRYALCTAEELPELIKEYPQASHWKIITLAP